MAVEAYRTRMVRSWSDTQYFLRRAEEERAAAKRASDPRAQQSHLDLAERYADAARTVTEAIELVDADPAQITSAPILQPEFRILRSEEHTSELQSLAYLVCRLLLET